MNVICPHCKNSVIVKEETIGKLATCSLCHNLFHVAKPDINQPFCPHCSQLLEENAKICIQCGYNIATKQCLKSKIEREYDRFPWWRKGLVRLYDVFPGLFKPVHVILFIASVFIALLLINLGVLVLTFGALLATIMLCSFGVMVYAQGVVFMLSTRLEFMNEAFVEIEGIQWTIFLIMVFGPALGLFLLMIHMAPET
jgi:hypothetical protein